MKKFITLAMAALLTVSMALPSAAANVSKIGKNANSVTATFAAATKTPTIDGKVDAGEYSEVKYSKDDLTIVGADDSFVKKGENTAMKLYASYDADKVYLAMVVDTPNYVQTEATKDNPRPLYRHHGLQLVCASGKETNAESHFGFGITRNSDTNDQFFVIYTDTYKYDWNGEAGKDYICSTKDGKTTYELAIPAKIFGVDKLVKGEKIRLCATALLTTKTTVELCVVEWGNGCYLAKNTQQSPLITLGDAPAAPATTPTVAPATADAVSVAVAALAISAAAAVVISKKH